MKNKGWTKEGMRHELASRGVRTANKHIKNSQATPKSFLQLLDISTKRVVSDENIGDANPKQVLKLKEKVNNEVRFINTIMEENGFIIADMDKRYGWDDSGDNFANYAQYGIKSCGIFDLYYVPKDPKAVGMKKNEWLRIDGNLTGSEIGMMFEILPKSARSYSMGNYKMRLLKKIGDNSTDFNASPFTTKKNLNIMINEMRKGNIVNAEECW